MNFREAATRAIRQVFCFSLGAADELWGRLGTPGTVGIPGFRLRGSIGYRLLCDREPPPIPGGGVGGQCPVVYEVVAIDTRTGIPGTDAEGKTVVWTNQNNPLIRLGPLRGAPTTTPVGSVVGGHTAGIGEVVLANGSLSGPFALTQKLRGPDDTNITDWRVVSRVYRFTRVDGSPDNCGDPPTVVPTPMNPPPVNEVPITYITNEGAEITVPAFIVFAIPFTFIDGTINAPFRLTIPTEFSVPIDGTINLETGDVNFNFGGGGGGGGGGCLPPPPDKFVTPEPPPPPPPGTIVNPVDIPGDDTRLKTIIAGAIVTTQETVGGATIIDQNANPDLYIPRVANLQFAIQIGNSVSWTERVNITSLRQFVPCLWEGGAIDVRVTAEPGYISFVTPVTRRIPDDSNYDAIS